MPAACRRFTIVLNSRTTSPGSVGEARVGREVRERVVAPVVRQAAVDERARRRDAWTGISSTAVTPRSCR